MTSFNGKIAKVRMASVAGFVLTVLFSVTLSAPTLRNTWRGITPLHSSGSDVIRLVGSDVSDDMPVGPFKVEGGEVTFSYLTPSLAKIYRAPRSMVGKVFTVYFKPSAPLSRADLALGPQFKRCVEERERTFYYFVSTVGVAYQLARASDQVETIIYQPTRAEVQSLAVNTECVF